MVETLSLIDQLIEEHKLILQNVQVAQQVANDVLALLALDRAKGDFVPGRFGDQQQGLQSLKESLEVIDQGLRGHFGREETGLLTVFEQHGGGMLASALRILLLEHEELLNRIAESKKGVAELAGEGLSREVWEGKEWGVRVYLSHTRTLLEVHTQSELELFHKLRSELRGHKEE